MISINGTRWSDLTIDDVLDHLSDFENETIFFEYKEDDASKKKIVKEICGFANTYGGYLFLGVNDKGEITGCKEWTENKVHSLVYDSISPAPSIDTRLLFDMKKRAVIVVRIEEGKSPPYISNDGRIYERVSSGTYPIKESGKLTHLNRKNDLYKRSLKEKIEFTHIDDRNIPESIYGYTDLGFSLQCINTEELYDKFRTLDLSPVRDYLKQKVKDFQINKIGSSYIFSIFSMNATREDGKEERLRADVSFFMEILADGSVRCRTLLFSDKGSDRVNVGTISFCYDFFSEIYSLVMGDNLYKSFVQAHKYESLHVLKQFKPILIEDEKKHEALFIHQNNHTEKYGGSIVITSNRIPKTDYLVIDRKAFDDSNIEYNNETLIRALFSTDYYDLGFIDAFKTEEDK